MPSSNLPPLTGDPGKDGLPALTGDPGKDFAPAPRTTYKDDHSILGGAVRDTLGLTGRPGAKTTAQVLLKPEGVTENIVREAALAPTWALGPAGRVAVAGGTGVANAIASGKSPSEMGWQGALDTLVAALAEGTLKGAGKLAGALGRQPAQEALAAVEHRLAGGKVRVPSLGDAPLSAREAAAKIDRLTGSARQVAAEEMGRALTQLEQAAQQMAALRKQLGGKLAGLEMLTQGSNRGPTGAPLAGRAFEKGAETATRAQRTLPTGFGRVAQGVKSLADNPAVRAGVDLAAVAPLDDAGTPAGLLPAMALKENIGFGGIARALGHAMGAP